jgi:hypothetical protein
MGMPRRIAVQGMQEIDASVVVTVVQGTVWMSISPLFTWEAILQPGKVDEIIHVLELARDEAEKTAVVCNGNALRAAKLSGRLRAMQPIRETIGSTVSVLLPLS